MTLCLQWFETVQLEIEARPAKKSVGCLSLGTKGVKAALTELLDEWKFRFADNLRAEARRQMEAIFDYIRQTETKLKKIPKSVPRHVSSPTLGNPRNNSLKAT